MYLKTRGILLQRIKYSESSIIIRVFTEKAGLQSFILKGIRSGKSKAGLGYLQPLALIEIMYNQQPNKSLYYLAELTPAHRFTSIPFDIYKSAVVLFLNEILNHCLKQEEPDENLFSFLYNAIEILDLKQNSGSVFHLIFLAKLSIYLGFYPKGNFNENNCYFDLQEGVFCHLPGETHIGTPYAMYLHQLMNLSFDESDNIQIPKNEKNNLIEFILSYYSYHIPSFGKIKSHKVLQQVFG